MAVSAENASGSTIDEFEKAAMRQAFLDPGCVIYDRMDDRYCTEQAGAELLRSDYPVSDLEPLTRHSDPRVRSLAIASLFAKADPKLLPLIFKLVDDRGPTFRATPVAMMIPG
jgi:hypothetical protein